MPNPYAIRYVTFQSGERSVLLVDRATGVPLFDPTLYSLKRLRVRNYAVNTIEAHLRAIMVLYLSLDIAGINLKERISTGKVLQLEEIEDIVSKCRLPLGELTSMLGSQEATPIRSCVLSLEAVRMSQRSQERHEVSSYPARVAYVRDYLDDFVLRRLQRVDQATEDYLRLETARRHMYQSFDARIPPRHKPLKRKLALSEDQIFILWDFIDPQSPANPFKGKFVRYRNSLLLNWLILLGLRRGELLGMRISDINWGERLVEVKRRHDSSDDPRRREARAKTLSGVVPISDELLLATHEYLTDPQLRSFHADRGNPFLFVSRNGGPLTESGTQHIFEEIRNTLPGLPQDFSPHICRHTCNYILSKAFDAEGISDEDEKARRRAFMRWSPTSQMPEHYNQRRTIEKANASALKAQIELFAGRHKVRLENSSHDD